MGDGQPPHPEAITVMVGYGLDIAAHRSRQVIPDDLDRADLTIAMAREHLRHAVVAVPAVWPRAFTLRELVRRGGVIGHRPSGESLADWLGRAHEGRERTALLGDCPDGSAGSRPDLTSETWAQSRSALAQSRSAPDRARPVTASSAPISPALNLAALARMMPPLTWLGTMLLAPWAAVT